MRRQRVIVVDVTKSVAASLEKAGFGNDSNNELDITKAGIWDLCDAVSGKDNHKFSVEQAREEMERRGL